MILTQDALIIPEAYNFLVSVAIIGDLKILNMLTKSGILGTLRSDIAEFSTAMALECKMIALRSRPWETSFWWHTFLTFVMGRTTP